MDRGLFVSAFNVADAENLCHQVAVICEGSLVVMGSLMICEGVLVAHRLAHGSYWTN
jgi:ABC-type Na+ transport system ATPase subunit NatA